MEKEKKEAVDQEIGLKLRELRKGKRFSQGDIEKRAGLLQCYVSRVEKGRTIPNVETLESLPEPWRFLCIGSSLTVMHQMCRSYLFFWVLRRKWRTAAKEFSVPE